MGENRMKKETRILLAVLISLLLTISGFIICSQIFHAHDIKLLSSFLWLGGNIKGLSIAITKIREKKDV
jgi:hypothetical protein